MNLQERRKAKGFNQKQLADIVGVSRSTIAMWENGASQPGNEMLVKLAEILETTTDYLLGAKKTPTTPADLPLTFDNIFPITKKRFPLLGEIACGEPIYADEDRESYVTAGADIQADFCLRAKGDSMIGARIWDGDIVFIKEMSMVNNGEIAAVIIDDEATLKRVYYDHDKAQLILQAENPKYAPIVITGEELNTVRILGKAIAFQSDVR